MPEGIRPVLGERVVVPFRRQRLVGIVTELHDRAPTVATKKVLATLDEADSPALSDELLRLGKWISEYYLAPVGEVFRTMLPLNAEFRREVAYRITEQGHLALHLAGETGSSRRSKKTADDQYAEYRVLDYLAARDQSREGTLKSAARVSRQLLDGMLRKQWIAREDCSHISDAARVRQVAVLNHSDGKLNDNQRMLVGEALRQQAGGWRSRICGSLKSREARCPPWPGVTAGTQEEPVEFTGPTGCTSRRV
jgi:primosomal protein N' (replication factor Y)